MNLTDYLADKPRGTSTDLAERLGVNRVLVSQWTSDKPRAVPVEHCPALERATGGAVTCEEQRPDVRWHRATDAAWPWHPQGRPLVDPSRAELGIEPTDRAAA